MFGVCGLLCSFTLQLCASWAQQDMAELLMYLAFLTFGGTTAFIPTFNAIIADTSTMQQRATFFAALSIAGNVASGLSSAISIIVQRLDLPSRAYATVWFVMVLAIAATLLLICCALPETLCGASECRLQPTHALKVLRLLLEDFVLLARSDKFLRHYCAGIGLIVLGMTSLSVVAASLPYG